VEALRAGRLVAFPTETVYGLGADACNDDAIVRVFETKGRARFNPLIAHVDSLSMARELVRFSEGACRLAERYWPGPLTLVLPRQEHCPVPLLAGAGLATLAVRCPSHPLARTLIQAFGGPLVAPSANRSGHVSATTAAHVRADFGEEGLLVLDGGATELGLESTIVDLSGTPTLLRKGTLLREEIEAVLGAPLEAPLPGLIRAPGALTSHYAPRLSVRLDATQVSRSEGLLAFGTPLPGAGLTVNLSESGDLREAAKRLFAALRELDRPELSAIAVMPIPAQGLGEAIVDQLRRAAAPRGDRSHALDEDLRPGGDGTGSPRLC
jgi:L-threonylcarbamoyladenylate synthase